MIDNQINETIRKRFKFLHLDDTRLLKKIEEGDFDNKLIIVDEAHNLIVVCEGEIEFEVFLNKKIIKKLKTGDCLYIPAGVYHRAVPLTDKRISCSFAIKTPPEKIKEEREWLRI